LSSAINTSAYSWRTFLSLPFFWSSLEEPGFGEEVTYERIIGAGIRFGANMSCNGGAAERIGEVQAARW
jgi:hypothetical protein